jgi:hypothetical protein
LVKLSGTNYDTTWASINSAAWGNITGTLSSQTDLYNALNGKLSLTGGTMSGDLVRSDGGDYNSTISPNQITILDENSANYSQLTTGVVIFYNDTGPSDGASYGGSGFNIGGGLLVGTNSGITFPDSSEQTTAFPPSGGLVTEYITGTGTLVTFPAVGDRYLTTSTTSLLIGNGTKTLTIGTGLSYTTQQDVTIAYDASNHMHATVTSYNSGTGVMVAQVHKHSGSGTFAAWTVNVGGVVGGLYLAIDNNLSELTATASTARSNLGLGSMATATATDYLTKAGNLSGLADTSVSRTNLGLGAVSTDAYATTAQAQAGTSTTTVVSPSTLLDAKYFQGGKSMVQIAWSTSVSGTGASASAQNSNARLNVAPTTATGYAIASAVIANNSRGSIFNSGFDFTKRVQFGVRVARNVASPDTASVYRFSIGKGSATDASDLAARGLMIKVAGSGALQLLVHNGTTLTSTTSSFTPTNGQAYDVIVTSDGAGNCALFVNGSSVATSSGGPTTAGSSNANFLMFEVQNTSIITGSPQNICVSDYHVQVNS